MDPKFAKLSWERDKRLLSRSGIELNLDWDSSLPGDAELSVLSEAVHVLFGRNAGETTTSYVEAVLGNAVEDLNGIWGQALPCSIDVHRIHGDRFLSCIGKINKVQERDFGLAVNSLPVRGLQLVPYKGEMLLSSKNLYCTVEEDWNPTLVRAPWNVDYLEFCIHECLSYAFFRQLRSEWGKSFPTVLKALDGETRTNILLFADMLSQYATAQLAEAKKPQWGVFSVASRHFSFLQYPQAEACYEAITSLASSHSLAAIAMADGVDFIGNVALPVFSQLHPYTEKKERMYFHFDPTVYEKPSSGLPREVVKRHPFSLPDDYPMN